MTVVIAPGPARSGMPRGTTATSSRSSVSSRSCAVSRVRERSPRSISNATPKRTIPPAILKAGIVNPNAAKIHWPEIAAAGGPFELIPGDDLELLAAALREPQRVRAPNLARLEALHRGDLPRVLERDFLECRHVPSHRCATIWRRADDCTTTML